MGKKFEFERELIWAFKFVETELGINRHGQAYPKRRPQVLVMMDAIITSDGTQALGYCSTENNVVAISLNGDVAHTVIHELVHYAEFLLTGKVAGYGNRFQSTPWQDRHGEQLAEKGARLFSETEQSWYQSLNFGGNMT